MSENIEVYKKLGFEYKRVGDIAKSSFFGFVFYKRIGILSKLFGVTYVHTTI